MLLMAAYFAKNKIISRMLISVLWGCRITGLYCLCTAGIGIRFPASPPKDNTMRKSEKKKLCVSCHDNRYNMGVGFQETSFDAVVTCGECWSLPSAKIVNKLVYYSVGDYKPTLRKGTLSCWHNEIGSGVIVHGKLAEFGLLRQS